MLIFVYVCYFDIMIIWNDVIIGIVFCVSWFDNLDVVEIDGLGFIENWF